MGKTKNNWDYLVDYFGNYVGSAGGGQKGAQGSTGAQGNKGDVGPAGSQGLIGLAGPAGPKGVKGNLNSSAFVFKGSVANAAALPATGNTTGDSYQTANDNTIHTWNGSSWIQLGGATAISVKGQKGTGGQKGILGTKGTTGTAGVKGQKGLGGQKGATGSLPLISTLPPLP